MRRLWRKSDLTRPCIGPESRHSIHCHLSRWETIIPRNISCLGTRGLCLGQEGLLVVAILRLLIKVFVISRMSAQDWKKCSQNLSRYIARLPRNGKASRCIWKILEWYLITLVTCQVRALNQWSPYISGERNRVVKANPKMMEIEGCNTSLSVLFCCFRQCGWYIWRLFTPDII